MLNFEDETESPAEEVEKIKDKIRHILSIYPRLSHSMLHTGLGPHIPSGTWRPILNSMVSEGEIAIDNVMVEDPSGKSRNYYVIFKANENLNA